MGAAAGIVTFIGAVGRKLGRERRGLLRRPDILGLKHFSRIFKHCNNPALLFFSFSSQYLSTEQEEMPHPQTGQEDSDGLLQCPKILLTCLRARISGGGRPPRKSRTDRPTDHQKSGRMKEGRRRPAES